MATAVAILVQSLAVSHDGGAAAPATAERVPQSYDAAALRLEAIHLLLLILQVPSEQVRRRSLPVNLACLVAEPFPPPFPETLQPWPGKAP